MSNLTIDQLKLFSVYETRVHSLTRTEARTVLAGILESREPSQIVTVNVDFLRVAEKSPAFQSLVNRAALAVPDGVPLVWVAHYLGLDSCERITGPDLVDIAAQLSVETHCKIFLIGGSPRAIDGTVDNLRRRYPGIEICGAFAPPEADYPFSEDLDEEICARIRAAQPDILFVGFGCPKQEYWIRDHLEQLEIPITVGVGGTFNFLSGRIARAPGRMQRIGLEWLYRLIREPRRLWRRYLIEDLPFMARLVWFEVASRSTRRATRLTVPEQASIE